MHWDNDWHDGYIGPGWLLVMVLVMLVFWGGLAWLLVTLIRGDGTAQRQPPASAAEGSPGAAPDPEHILHERLARGEIDVDEYHQRIDAFRAKRPPPL